MTAEELLHANIPDKHTELVRGCWSFVSLPEVAMAA